MTTGTMRRAGSLSPLLAALVFAACSCTPQTQVDQDAGTDGSVSLPDGSVADGGEDGGVVVVPDGGDGGITPVDGGPDGGPGECAGSPPCAENAERSPSCACFCKQGYVGNASNSVCLNAAPCDSHAIADVSPSNELTCTCGPGYYGDGFKDGTACTFNACYRPGPPPTTDGDCPEPAGGGDNHCTCINVGERGRAVCEQGYVGQNDDGGTLVACLFNECSPNPCDTNASCEVTPTGHTCTCNAPLVGNGTPGNCKPVNHCNDSVRYCDSHANCLYNEVNGTTCQCHADFQGDGRPNNCHLINHCADETPFCDENATCTYHDTSNETCSPACSSSQVCENGRCVNPGTFCACKPGYDNTGSPVGGPGHCIVHNFCNDMPRVCDAAATCTSTPGIGVGYTCACPLGQAGAGTDEDPCHAGYASYSTGSFGACAVRSDQALFCWGDASQGAVGNGQIDPNGSQGSANVISEPTQVGVAVDWLQVAGGEEHVCAIRSASGSTTQGTLWCWGLNQNGQIGYDTYTPADAAHHPELGYNSGTPKQVGLSSDWTKVVTGWKNTCALKADSSLWCWGYDYFGTVVNGTTTNAEWLGYRAPSPANACISDSTCTGAAHCVAGQCQGLNYPSVMVPAQVSIEGLPGTDLGWVDMAVGNDHVCAIRDDGKLYCWGRNSFGQIGNGTNVNSDVPIQVPAGGVNQWTTVAAGNSHSLAIRSDGTIWCWGDNASAVCGQGIVTGQLPAPRNTPGEVIEPRSMSPWSELSCGPRDDHCCAIKADHSLWCWGNNARGESGQPTGGLGYVSIPLAVRDLPAGVTFNSVEAGGGFTCALDTQARLWCFGDNSSGQLGRGSEAGDPAKPGQTK